MANFVYRGFVKDALGGVPDLDSDTIKCPLLGTLQTDASTTSYGYGSLSGELASGGGYTTGGVTLGSPVIGVNAGEAYFHAANAQWTSATLTAVKGAVIYDDTVTTPTADPLIAHYDFGNPSGISVTSGTLTLSFAAAGSGGLVRITV